jgi:hypothetical protein
MNNNFNDQRIKVRRYYLENPSKWSISPFFGLVVDFLFQQTLKSSYIILEK